MGTFDLKALQQRTLSAFILILVVLFAVAWGGIPFYLMIVLLAGIALHEWILMARRTDSAVLHGFLGILYILTGFLFCVLIREDIGFSPGVLFLLMVWGADIGAYFTGKYFGGPKMAPRISPNKTWAGLGGGCSFAAIAAVLYFLLNALFFSPEPSLSAVGILFVFMLGIIITFAGQGGDLIISAMKRKTGLKDTGSLIPGHGGLLDRIDSMLLAAPVFYFLFLVLAVDM